MVPFVDQMNFCNFLHLSEVHHHAIICTLIAMNNIANQCNLYRVAVSVQMTALALMLGNPMPRVEFKAASDLHGEGDMLDGHEL